ncbi:MAG: MHYT domain-containing protein [Lysobacterales bacterium]
MEGTYSIALVLISYLVACAASFTALEVVRRLMTRREKHTARWVATGALTMGVGIWTMHFVGMLAYSMPMAVKYDVTVTFVSLLVGVGAAGLAIFIAARFRMSVAVVAVSGVVLGLGISSMHGRDGNGRHHVL